VENIGSEKVLLKAGMQFEGIMRGAVFAHGIYNDAKLFAVLATDKKG
jgi:ribosomal-protein-alanine N-acetyltransferase